MQSWGSMSFANEKLTLIDVGGLGGLQEHWKPFIADICPIVFEPNTEQAALIRPAIEAINGGKVMEFALAHAECTMDLNITKSLGCTSLLKPNDNLLNRYSISGAFQVEKTIPVDCVRYDSLFSQDLVPQPDAIKIDVQGFEYQVLLGFGGLLENCLGIQLEAHLLPIYHDQKLLNDLVDLLYLFELSPRKIVPVNHFDGDIVEVDIWFTANKQKISKLDSNGRRKLDIILKAWEIEGHRDIFHVNSWG